ncbi:hypothetical protein GCM10009609_33220 [Pseudonocardia aurantiaca]
MAGSAAPLRAMPPVEQMSSGLWSLPLPLPLDTLRHVFVYVFETPQGPYLIDAGWDTPDGWDALCAGLDRIGTGVHEVQGLLVTHALCTGRGGRARARPRTARGRRPGGGEPHHLAAQRRHGTASRGRRRPPPMTSLRRADS